MAAPSDVDAPANVGLCGVCLQKYTDPRILPCLHTLCKDCIVKLSVTEEDGKMTCPFCRATCGLPESGAAGLPKDFITAAAEKAILNRKPSASSASCFMCDGGDTSNTCAAWWCEKCEGALCDSHIAPHIMATKGERHVITSLDLAAKAGCAEGKKVEATEDIPLCQKHNQPLRLQCGSCDVSICGDCVFFGDHQGHAPIRRISDILEERKAQLTQKVNNLQHNTAVQLQQSLEAIDQVCSELERRAKEVCVDIQQAGERAVQTVKAHVLQMLQEVDDMKEGRLKVLHQQREELERHLAAVKNAICFSQKIMQPGQSGEAFFSLLHVLQTHVDTLIATKIPEQPQHHSHLHFQPANNVALSRKAKETIGGVKLSTSCASAIHSVIEGGLSKTASTRHGVKFTVLVRDEKNKALTVGGDMITPQWVQTSDPSYPEVAVEDHNDGSYTILCTAVSAGSYKLDVIINGEHMQNQLCILYTDLQWDVAESNLNLTFTEHGRRASLGHTSTDFYSIVGSVAMHHGHYTWKIRFGDSSCHAGVTTKPLSAPRKQDYCSLAYNWYGGNGGSNVRDGIQWDGTTVSWLASDTVKLTLDCDQHTMQIMNLRSGVSSTFMNLPDKEYYPFATLRISNSFAELIE